MRELFSTHIGAAGYTQSYSTSSRHLTSPHLTYYTQRQRSKAGLASVMSEDQEQGDGSGFGSKMPALSLTKKDVMQLMHPKAVTGDTTSIRTHGKVTHPATQSTSSSTSSTSILQDRETADASNNDLIDEEKRDILSPLHRFLPQGSGPKDSILEFALTHFDEKVSHHKSQIHFP